MTLLELQREVAAAIMSPADPSLNGSSAIDAVIKSNRRLTSIERLGIYRDSYWSRVIGSLEDDYPGVRGILGTRIFAHVARQYLAECPSRSFTLRNLGREFADWLKTRFDIGGPKHALVLDMARLEWAHIEAFDAASHQPLVPEHLLEPDPEMHLGLQPHLMLLAVGYPVDDLRLRLVEIEQEERRLTGGSKRRRQLIAVRKCLKGEQADDVFLAVHRREFTVYYRRLQANEFHLLQALGGGATLSQALELAQAPTDVLVSWFEAWSQLGWLVPASKIAHE